MLGKLMIFFLMLFQNFGHLGGFLKNQFQDVLINFISIQNLGT
jgi:hypothetical protein